MTDFDDLHVLSHREAAARFAIDGWNVCGLGDWATVWRSPDGFHAARLSPFELAYEVFVELCRNLTDHALLPRIDFDAPLVGGGRLTVMEFMLPAAESQVADITARWESAASDDPVAAVRLEAERLNDKAASLIPYWGGLELNPGNIMTDLSGQAKLVDLYFVPGDKVFPALEHNPTDFAARIPADRRKYLADIACAARVWTPAQIAKYRKAEAALPSSFADVKAALVN
jgi:hypothetical protein